MSDRFPEFGFQALDSNGDPISGAKLKFFQTLTSTPKSAYSDAAKTSAFTEITADAAGRFGEIFMDTDVAYKVEYTDASDVVIKTWDPVSPVRGSIVTTTPVTSKSSNFNVLATDRGTLFEIDASSGSVNAALLAAATAGNNFEVSFKKIDSSANAVTVDGDGSETIDGATTQTLSTQYDSIVIVCDGTEWHIKSEHAAGEVAPLPRGYISGLTLSNDGSDSDHDIDIAIGECRDNADGVNIALSSALIKQIDASWVAGTNQGGLSSSLTLSADTLYYVHGIIVGGSSDVGFDTSATAANLVADHSATAFRVLGWVVTDSSSNIINGQFAQTVVGGKTFKFPDFATTSGTTVDITNMPAGVQAFDVVLDTVSDSASHNVGVQLGDSGGIQTANYVGRCVSLLTTNTDWTSSALVGEGVSATRGVTGIVHFRRLTEGSNVWLIGGTPHEGSAGAVFAVGGEKTLSGELTTVRLLTTGTAFDGGSFSIKIAEIIPD